MKKLGKVLHVSPVTKRLILRCSEQLLPKGYVVDATGFVVGKIDDVFGPVTRPYCAVKLARGIDPEKYVGSQLFVVDVAEKFKNLRKAY